VALGTLCAIDHAPRGITRNEIDALRTLPAHVNEKLQCSILASQLADAERRLEDAASSRDEFLAMLAHELRAPLAPINTAVELLDAEEATDAQQTRARAVLRRQSRYMSEIVDNLLAASLVSVGAIHLTLVGTSLRSMIDLAIELAQPDIDRRGHEFALKIDESLYVYADLIQCPLIVSNLLGNAAKYTQYGGHITLTATADGTNVAITVQDDGAGIAADDIEDIFQLVRQTPRPSARSAGGMGLGLTLARRLAEMHGARLPPEATAWGKAANSR
jgi:signal transduction histidine kinase